jgi:hypothetical protein
MDDQQRDAPADPHHPPEEPGPAELTSAAEPGPIAPHDPAPDLADIEPGDGPGQTPGE